MKYEKEYNENPKNFTKAIGRTVFVEPYQEKYNSLRRELIEKYGGFTLDNKHGEKIKKALSNFMNTVPKDKIHGIELLLIYLPNGDVADRCIIPKEYISDVLGDVKGFVQNEIRIYIDDENFEGVKDEYL